MKKKIDVKRIEPVALKLTPKQMRTLDGLFKKANGYWNETGKQYGLLAQPFKWGELKCAFLPYEVAMKVDGVLTDWRNELEAK